jgi:hypothetical protein
MQYIGQRRASSIIQRSELSSDQYAALVREKTLTDVQHWSKEKALL